MNATPMKKCLVRIGLAFAVCSPLLAAGAPKSAPTAPTQPETVLPAGTQITVRLAQALDTRRDRAGTRFTAHLAAPVSRNGVVILPQGAVCRGHVVESKQSGRLRGRAVMGVAIDSVERQGKAYRVTTSTAARVSKDHKKRNLLLIGGIASAGAAIGAATAGSVGALVGTGAGAGVGTTGALATGIRNVHLAPETRLTVALRQPVTVRM